MKICILYGGKSREREISLISGSSILKSLSNIYDVYGYDFDGDYTKLYNAVCAADLVFNSLHGGEGEDGQIQKFFDQVFIFWL